MSAGTSELAALAAAAQRMMQPGSKVIARADHPVLAFILADLTSDVIVAAMKAGRIPVNSWTQQDTDEHAARMYAAFGSPGDADVLHTTRDEILAIADRTLNEMLKESPRWNTP